MLGGALQDDCSHRSELRRIKLGGASRFGHCPQSINAADFKQPFPCVHGLPCNAHGYFGTALARVQHSRRSQSDPYLLIAPLVREKCRECLQFFYG